jgi:photosystem II stability/assembly factor-like uncharacterized protein
MPETVGGVGRGRRLVAVGLACALCLGASVVHVATTAQPALAVGVGSPGTAFLHSIAFGDANHGWAVGSTPSGGGLIAATTNAGVTWTNQSFPKSSVGQFEGIAAAGSTTAWAVGYVNTATLGTAGVVMATTDGTLWSAQTVPNVDSLNGVSFVSPTTGWAVGSYSGAGAILATIDGGTTWTSQVVPSGVVMLSSVSFVDASHGWAAGQISGNTASQSAIIATNDGGANWAPEAVPTDLQLDAITFRDSTHGWAGGYSSSSGQVIATTDGGRTWAVQTLPAAITAVMSVAFASLSVGWIVGTNYSGFGKGGAPSVITPLVAATTDGGATWTSQAPPVTTTTLYGVTALSSTKALAVGSGTCQYPSILATSNGGGLWTEMLNPVPILTGLGGVTSVDSTHAWAVGTDSCGSSAIVRTTDGATWTAAQVPAGVGWGQGLRAVSFVDRNHGWAVGSKYNGGYSPLALALVTNDGGATWSASNIPDGVGVLVGVHFISATQGWVVGLYSGSLTSLILTTSDGGQSWTSLALPAGVFNLDGVWFSDSLHGWVTGSEGHILFTSDGGASWTSQTIPTNSSPYGIDFADSMNGWAAGQNSSLQSGQVLSTGDGGTTWTAHTVASAYSLDAVSFPNTTSGWVTGVPAGATSGGFIAASTNAGATWVTQAVPSGVSDLGGVSAASPTNAWAVGTALAQGPYGIDAAVILGTSNAGATWTAQPPYTYPGMPRQGILPALSNAAYGGYTTAAYIQNLGAAPASVQVNYFDAGGNPVGSGDSNVIQPHGTWIVRQDNGRSFAAGQAGSGVILGSQPLAAFVNEFAPNSGDATSYTGITSGVGITLYAPAIANGAYGGYTTGIGLVNLAASLTNITVTYRDGTGATMATQNLPNLAAGAYQGVYSGTAGLPSGFAGTATITSSAGNLAAVVNETGPGNQFSSYDAVAAGSTTSFAPVALSNAYGGYNTGMAIQNTTGGAGTVTITYYDSSGTATVKTSPIMANGYLGVYQGTDIPVAGAYTAKLTSSVAVAAIVNEVAPSNSSAKQSTAYNTSTSGSSSLHLPLVESAGTDGWSTGEGIMNTGAIGISVTVTYYDTATGVAVGTPQTQPLAINAFWDLYQPTGGLPSGTRATAVITTSTGGQVAVICNESGSSTFMSYDGQ